MHPLGRDAPQSDRSLAQELYKKVLGSDLYGDDYEDDEYEEDWEDDLTQDDEFPDTLKMAQAHEHTSAKLVKITDGLSKTVMMFGCVRRPADSASRKNRSRASLSSSSSNSLSIGMALTATARLMRGSLAR